VAGRRLLRNGDCGITEEGRRNRRAKKALKLNWNKNGIENVVKEKRFWMESFIIAWAASLQVR